MAVENSRGRVSLVRPPPPPPHRTGPPRVLRLAGDRPDHDLSLSVALPLSLFFIVHRAYHAIGGEDSLPVSPPLSLRFSRAPSRGTDWTIHHRCFSLSFSPARLLFLRLTIVSSPVSIAKESDTHVLRRCAHMYIYYLHIRARAREYVYM